MFALDLITKKRLGQQLNEEEVNFLVNSYTKNQIPDYQMSAFLMAVMFQDLSDQELIYFTEAFINSGQKIDLSKIKGVKVDKHSTGGIGDKVTLIIGPIMAALNINFAKMSGSSLGFTGGTIDKLLSIPNYNVNLSISEFIEQVNKIKISVIAQTNNLVPADKKIYALRDVTDTVDSIALITMSIMSKKIAMGADKILLDVKCGSGAFMKNFTQAKLLAKKMIKVGKVLKKDVKVEITNMDEPLGKTIGNKIEVLEAIEVLKGQGDLELKTLVLSSCTTMLKQAKPNITWNKSQQMIEQVINNGQALKKFKLWIKTQGGDVDLLFSNKFWNPKFKLDLKSSKSGFLTIVNAINFGICSLKLGGGRKTKDDIIDYEAGIYLHKKTGDQVFKNQVLFTLYSSNPIDEELKSLIAKSYVINQKRQTRPIILQKY